MNKKLEHLELSDSAKSSIKQIVDKAMLDLGQEAAISRLTNLKVSIDISNDSSMPKYSANITFYKVQAGQISYDKTEEQFNGN